MLSTVAVDGCKFVNLDFYSVSQELWSLQYSIYNNLRAIWRMIASFSIENAWNLKKCDYELMLQYVSHVHVCHNFGWVI